MEPTASLSILDKLIEVLGLKDLVKDGIKSLSGEGRAKRVGFRFYSLVGALQEDVNGYIDSFERYVERRVQATSEEYEANLAEVTRGVLHVHKTINEVLDILRDIPQLGVYFPEAKEEIQSQERSLQANVAFFKSEELALELELELQLKGGWLSQLRERLDGAKARAKELKVVADSVRSVLNKEWSFKSAF